MFVDVVVVDDVGGGSVRGGDVVLVVVVIILELVRTINRCVVSSILLLPSSPRRR